MGQSTLLLFFPNHWSILVDTLVISRCTLRSPELVYHNSETVAHPIFERIKKAKSRAERKTIVTDVFMKSSFLHIFVPVYNVHVPPNFRSGCIIIY